MSKNTPMGKEKSSQVCYYGTYRTNYNHNQMMMAGLRLNGVDVIECHETLWNGIEDWMEITSGENSNWLPTGKSLFCDKHIPRENLNGLQIAKTGLAAALYQLTGIGGSWAQDPPFYADG